MIPQEHSFTHIHALLYTRTLVKCGGESDEESRLLVEIHLVVTRVVVVVVVVVVMVSWVSGGETSKSSRNWEIILT